MKVRELLEVLSKANPDAEVTAETGVRSFLVDGVQDLGLFVDLGLKDEEVGA